MRYALLREFKRVYVTIYKRRIRMLFRSLSIGFGNTATVFAMTMLVLFIK